MGGDETLSELLTCSDFSIDREPLVHTRVVGLHEFRTRTGRLSYHCRLEPFSLSVGDELVGRFSPEHRMDVFYPGGERQGTPVTRIGWHIEPASLVVETVHSYPEQEIGVRSRSRFKLRHGAA